MKYRILLMSLFVLFITNNCFANWYELNTSGKVVPVSKIAKVGKISIFIISTPWCKPCKILKDELKRQDYDMSVIDFYYVNSFDDAEQYRKREDCQNVWQNIEMLDAWPYVYITAPTSNIVSNFSPQTETNMLGRINKVISILYDNTKHFNSNLVFDTNEDKKTNEIATIETKEKTKKNDTESNLEQSRETIVEKDNTTGISPGKNDNIVTIPNDKLENSHSNLVTIDCYDNIDFNRIRINFFTTQNLLFFKNNNENEKIIICFQNKLFLPKDHLNKLKQQKKIKVEEIEYEGSYALKITLIDEYDLIEAYMEGSKNVQTLDIYYKKKNN